MIKNVLTLAAVALCGTILSGADIFLAGDSTCASYSAKSAPLPGWGQVLPDFCKAGVKVNNLAISGASSKSYIDSKAWDKLIAKVKKGDFVVIQFGHNDSHTKRAKQYTVPGGTYDANLKKFIADVRSKGGVPVIATSIARGNFDKQGKIALAALKKYCDAARKVAKDEKADLADLNAETVKLFNSLKKEGTRKLFMCSSQDPKRKNDVTHVNKEGASAIAKLFVDAAKAQKLPIAECFK
jgi:lysophospholipase L1-like esterase